MDLFDQLTLFIVSLVANLFSAFSGGGAGLLQLPVLIFLGLPFAIAVPRTKSPASHWVSARLSGT